MAYKKYRNVWQKNLHFSPDKLANLRFCLILTDKTFESQE